MFDILKRKKEDAKDVEKDIVKLKREVKLEEKLYKKESHRSALLETKKTLLKQLFADKQKYKKDLNELRFKRTAAGKVYRGVIAAEQKGKEFFAKPETKKALKKLDKFLGG